MKKTLYFASLIALALVGCNPLDGINPDVPMVEREKEPVVFEGSGTLVAFDDDENEVETPSTYAWNASDDLINISVEVDLNDYKERGSWEIGHFTLSASTIAEFLGGVSPADLDETTFYAIEPDGSVVEDMTSYKPGMWVDSEGASCGWSSGAAYWQWYVWGGKTDKDGNEIGYDWDYSAHPGIFVLGGNPGVTMDMAGKSLKTEARIVAGGQTYRLVINYKYSELEKSVEGEGNLLQFEYDENWDVIGEFETNSTYYYKVTESSVLVEFQVDTDEFIEYGDWSIGHFTFDSAIIEEMLGFNPGDLDETSFYPIDQFGEACGDFTSYAPGMWIDAEGASSDWASGAAYWQWYVWPEVGRDFEYEGNEDMFIIGSNPGNVSKITYGETFGSYAMMEHDGNSYDITVNFTFQEHITTDEGYQNVPMYAGNGGLAYSSGVDGDNQFFWYLDQNDGLEVDVFAYTPTIIANGDWEFLALTIDPSVLEEAGVDLAQLGDISYFYATAPDGTPYDSWSSYEPGMWLNAAGETSNWADGCLYWQYQYDTDHSYDGHHTDGLLVLGCNPDNIASFTETVVTGTAMMGTLPVKINVIFGADYPYGFQDTFSNGNAFQIELTETAVNVNASCSLANLDDSWNWWGVAFNEKYINEYYGIDFDTVSADLATFYPVAPDGTPYEAWSSYEPGMWFDADGASANWSTGWSFWQYYTHSTYDYEIENLWLFGNNCNPEIFSVGQSVTSKAVMKAGEKDVDWNVTLTIVD